MGVNCWYGSYYTIVLWSSGNWHIFNVDAFSKPAKWAKFVNDTETFYVVDGCLNFEPCNVLENLIEMPIIELTVFSKSTLTNQYAKQNLFSRCGLIPIYRTEPPYFVPIFLPPNKYLKS